jgi:hypothetical protein
MKRSFASAELIPQPQPSVLLSPRRSVMNK